MAVNLEGTRKAMKFRYRVCKNGMDVRWSYGEPDKGPGEGVIGTYIDNAEAAIFFAQQVKKLDPDEVVTVVVCRVDG